MDLEFLIVIFKIVFLLSLISASLSYSSFVILEISPRGVKIVSETRSCAEDLRMMDGLRLEIGGNCSLYCFIIFLWPEVKLTLLLDSLSLVRKWIKFHSFL